MKEREGNERAKERESNMAEEQEIIEGYGCCCGFTSQDKKEFNSHLLHSARRDGKGTHKSIGRVDLSTGEVTALPWSERDPEERKSYMSGKKPIKALPRGEDGDGHGGDGRGKGTQALAGAQTIRVIPRVYTMDYSPIMRAAQDAAITLWGWRPEMPLGNFIDTCLYLFFEEKGITLCGYIIDDALLEKEEQHAG